MGTKLKFSEYLYGLFKLNTFISCYISGVCRHDL